MSLEHILMDARDAFEVSYRNYWALLLDSIEQEDKPLDEAEWFESIAWKTFERIDPSFLPRISAEIDKARKDGLADDSTLAAIKEVAVDAMHSLTNKPSENVLVLGRADDEIGRLIDEYKSKDTEGK